MASSTVSPPVTIPGTDFLASTGKHLRLVCGVEDVLSADGAAVGVRINPTVVDLKSGRVLRARARTKLDASDFWEMDLAVFRAARPLLEQPERPVIAPISFHTASRARACKRLFEMTELSADQTYKALIAEVVGVDHGTPSGRLTDAIGLLRPLGSAVFAEVLSPGFVKQVIDHPLAGLTLDLRDGRRSDAALLARLREFQAAGGRVRNLLARGLPSMDWLEPAAAAGITHVSVRK